MNKTAYTLIALAAIAFATLFNYSAAFSSGKSSVPAPACPDKAALAASAGAATNECRHRQPRPA